MDDQEPARRACPRCGAARLVRSHTRVYERPRRWISGTLYYRCKECHWRGWDPRDKKPEVHHAWSRLGIAGVAVAIAVVIAASLLVRSRWSSAAIAGSSRALPTAALPTPRQPSLLALVSSRVYLNAEGDSWNISGEVRNLAQEPLTNLQVVSTWFDREGQQIEVHVDLVDLKQVMPGGTSTFRSVARARSEMARFRLEFHSNLGTVLLTEEGTPTP